MKAPCVNAAGHVVKPAANVHGQLAKRGLQLLRILVVVAVFALRIPAPPVRRRASGQTATACSAPRAIPARPKAHCARPPAVDCCCAAGQRIFARCRQVLRGRAAKSLQNRLEESAQHQKLLRQPIAQPQPRAVGKHKRGHQQAPPQCPGPLRPRDPAPGSSASPSSAPASRS